MRAFSFVEVRRKTSRGPQLHAAAAAGRSEFATTARSSFATAAWSYIAATLVGVQASMQTSEQARSLAARRSCIAAKWCWLAADRSWLTANYWSWLAADRSWFAAAWSRLAAAVVTSVQLGEQATQLTTASATARIAHRSWLAANWCWLAANWSSIAATTSGSSVTKQASRSRGRNQTQAGSQHDTK